MGISGGEEVSRLVGRKMKRLVKRYGWKSGEWKWISAEGRSVNERNADRKPPDRRETKLTTGSCDLWASFANFRARLASRLLSSSA